MNGNIHVKFENPDATSNDATILKGTSKNT